MAADPTDLGGLLQGLTSNPLLYMGLGLLSQRGPGSSVGGGLLQGLGAYQQNRAANQQYQLGQLNLDQQKMLRNLQMQQIQAAMGGGASPAAPPAAAPAAPPPQSPQTPQQQILNGTWLQQPSPPPPVTNPFAPVTADQRAAIPLPGRNVGLERAMAFLDPTKLHAIDADQLAEAKRLHSGALAEAAGVANGSLPITHVSNNPNLAALFQQTAPRILGVQNPDITDTASVRRVAAAWHDGLGGSLDEANVNPVLPVLSASMGGVSYTQDPTTLKPSLVEQPRMYPTAAGFLPPSQAQHQLPASESPTLAANKAGAVARATIEPAAERAAVVGNAKAQTAAQAGLAALEGSQDAQGNHIPGQFENFRATAAKLDFGSNKVLNGLRLAAAGKFVDDPDIRAYVQAHADLVSDLSRVLSRGGVVTDSVRNQAQEAVPLNMGTKSVDAVIDQARKAAQATLGGYTAAGAAARGQKPPPMPPRPGAKPAAKGLSDADLLKKWGQ